MSNQDRSRPPGKHSDPDYIMIGAYVRRSVYDETKKKLAAGDADFSDFSELLEELLAPWLAGR